MVCARASARVRILRTHARARTGLYGIEFSELVKIIFFGLSFWYKSACEIGALGEIIKVVFQACFQWILKVCLKKCKFLISIFDTNLLIKYIYWEKL